MNGGGGWWLGGYLILFMLVIGSLRRPYTFPTPKGSTKCSIIPFQEAVFTYSCASMGVLVVVVVVLS